MLSRSKLYERRPPTKDATLFLIFCEGSNTEPKYFRYFSGISSQIRLIPIAANPEGDNSPTGLFYNAVKAIVKSVENPSPEYEVNPETDQVWFVVDTDEWGAKLDELKGEASNRNWFVAQSNPCFEVWLYFHRHRDHPDFEDNHLSTTWKKFLGEAIPGGFDHRKHPILIADAIAHAETHYQNTGEDINKPPCTEVHLLAQSFYPYVKEQIEKERAKSK